MADADLSVGISCAGELVEYLCINHGPARLQFVIAEKAGRIEFESTIDIAHVDTENHADQYFPTPGIDLTHPGILAINTIPQHGIVCSNQWEEALKVMDIKLSIRIHKKSQIFADCLKATNQG